MLAQGRSGALLVQLLLLFVEYPNQFLVFRFELGNWVQKYSVVASVFVELEFVESEVQKCLRVFVLGDNTLHQLFGGCILPVGVDCEGLRRGKIAHGSWNIQGA